MSVLYIIQTDSYDLFVSTIFASVVFHQDCLHRLFRLLKGTFMNKLQKNDIKQNPEWPLKSIVTRV